MRWASSNGSRARRSWRQAGPSGCAAPRSACPSPADVVHRFVPGETVADALDSVGQLREFGPAGLDRLPRRGRHRRRRCQCHRRRLPRRLLDALGRRGEPRLGRATARGVAEAVGAGTGVAPRRREDRAGERPHHLRAGAAGRGVGDRGRRGSHHHRLDAVDRAGTAHRVRLAGHGSAGLPAAHPGRLRGVRRVGCADPVVQGRLRRARVGGLPRS